MTDCTSAPTFGVKTDAGTLAACPVHLLPILREHLAEGTSIRYSVPDGSVCGQRNRVEYELVVSRSSERSGDGFDVYTVRVLEFLGAVGEYDTVEHFEVTLAPGGTEETQALGIAPGVADFTAAVDIAVAILRESNYTVTQAFTYRGSIGDGRVSK